MLQLGTCIGLPCADGGDPQCEGTVEVCTTLAMPKKRMRQAFEDGSIELTKMRGKPRTFSAGMDSVAGASLPLRLLKPVLA